MLITKEDIKDAIIKAGLSNEIICIHSSLSSFGEVAGGAKTVINAFLEAGCTLLAPAFYYDYQIPPMEEIEQNGLDDDYRAAQPHDRIYSPDINGITSDMGAIPREMINTAGRHRGNHPTNSFVALGPEADDLIKCQTYENVYGPFQMMMDKRGKIILMGVGLNKMTAIHYSEKLAGRELLIRWALDENGNPARIRVGSCSEAFENLAQAVSGFEQRITVGNSLWRIYPIYETVQACAAAIKKDSHITHCPNSNCEWCNDMEKGGPVLS